MAEFYNIDPWSADIKDLELEIKNLKAQSEYWESAQLGLKLTLNGSYGCIASKYFFGHVTEVAEAITLQGQDLNHFSENALNKFINEVFVEEVKLGKYDDYNITVEQCKFIRATAPHGLNTAAIGGDTDSLYISLDTLMHDLGLPENIKMKFIVDLYLRSIKPYLESCFEKYAKAYNCDKNYEVFELEKIARTCLYYAKKKYSMEVAWEEPNIFLDPMSHVIFKGLEVVQGSTPKYARACQIDFIKFVLESYYRTGDKPNYADCIEKLRGYKAKFALQPIDDICKGQNIGDYEKFIANDRPNEGMFAVKLHTPIHVKAAGVGNYLLFSNKKFLSKYSILKTSGKCKFYYTKNAPYDVFGFEPGKFPVEFALPIDYDIQFTKLILDPLNRLIADVMKYQPLNEKLAFSKALF